MSYTDNDLKAKAKQLAREMGTRSKYSGIKMRLYFGEDNFEDQYEQYILWFSENFEYSEYDDMIMALDDYEKITGYIESQRNKISSDTNKYWKTNQEEFVKLLSGYIKSSFKNENAKKKYLYKLINENKTDSLHCFFELIQNADDCEFENKDEKRKFTIDFSDLPEEKTITVSYNEKGMTHADIISLTSFNESNKAKNTDQIGEKGQGFKTVFYICDWVEFDSGEYSFRYNCILGNEEADITIEPKERADNIKGTRIVMHLKEDAQIDSDNVCDMLLAKYGFNKDIDNQNAFLNCPIMFTKHLNSMCIKRDEDDVYEISNLGKGNDFKLSYKHGDEEISIDYIRYENSVTFSEDEWKSRYGDNLPYNADNNYKIYIAAPKNVKDSGISKGRLYSFLPTEQIINSPVNIHFPAYLDSSRSTFGSGSGKHIAWNRRLVWNFFAEDGWYVDFFELMKTKAESAELINYLAPDAYFLKDSDLDKLFDEYRSTSYNMRDEIPAETGGYNEETDIYRRLKIFQSKDGQWRTGSEIWMPDDFVKDFDEAYFEKFKEYANGEFPTEYCDAFINNSELIKLTGYREVSEGKYFYDRDNTAILKKLMDEGDRERIKAVRKQIIDYAVNGKTSKYFPENQTYLLELKLFKRRIYDGNGNITTRYYAADKDKAVWVYGDNMIKATPSSSFIRVCDREDTIFKQLNVFTGNYSQNLSRSHTPVYEHIIDQAADLSLKNAEHLKDILSFIAGIEEPTLDWYEFGKTLFTDNKYITNSLWNDTLSKLMSLETGIFRTDDPDFESKKYMLLVLGSRITHQTARISHPLNQWSTELIDAVIDADGKKEYKIDLQASMVFRGFARNSGLFENYKKWEEFQRLTVYVGNDTLPEGRDFFHYNSNVVLRDKKYQKKAADSILSGATHMVEWTNTIDEIMKRDDVLVPFDSMDKVRELGIPLQKKLAFEYEHTLIGKYREDTKKEDKEDYNTNPYGENIISYELVQNADDCRKRGKVYAEKINAKLDSTLEINYKYKSRLSLKYPDAGFSPRDLISLCSRQNTANTDHAIGTTGKKGTGFKSVFRDFFKVSVKSNYFKITLSKTNHPHYTMNKMGDISFDWGDWPEYETKPLEPIPFFEYTNDQDYTTELTLFSTKDKMEEVLNDLSDFRTYLFADDIKRIILSNGEEIVKTEDDKTLKIEFSGHRGNQGAEFYKYKAGTVTVLFPTQNTITILSNIKPPRKGENPVIYVKMPLDDIRIPYTSDLCFFVNASDIKVTESRKNSLGDREITGIGNDITSAFEAFANDYPQIAYRNYPIGEFYELFKHYSIYFSRCEFIPVIPAGSETEEIEFRSIYDLDTSLDKILSNSNCLEYTLGYYEIEDFLGLLRLVLIIKIYRDPRYDDNKRRAGKLMLTHYKKYTGKDDCTPDTPIYELDEIDVNEEIAGYSTIEILTEKLAKAFGMKTSEFVISKSMFKNVRKTLFVNNEMDDFAEKVITKYKKQLTADTLFPKVCQLEWENRFFDIFGADLLEKFSEKSISKNTQPRSFMHFKDKEPDELPPELSEMFEDYKKLDDFYDKPVLKGMNAAKIMDKKKFYESERSLLFWSADDQLIIFGKDKFKYIFKDLFGLKNERESIAIDEPIYSLPKVRGLGFSDELKDKNIFIAAAESFPPDTDILTNKNPEPLMRRLDIRFSDDEGKNYCYHWKGYGAKTSNEDTACPVCGGKQVSAHDNLKIYEIGKYGLPLLMCENCAKYYKPEKTKNVFVYKYSTDKTQEPEKLLREELCDYITKNCRITLGLYITYKGEKEPHLKTTDVFLTTPHRILIYKMYKEEEE